MKQKTLILLFVFLIGIMFNLCNASEKNEKQLPKSIQLIDKLQSDLQLIKDALQEVRRDQLNYRIEKDLLKETYSSYIQMINIVITIILGVFTIIGFLGVRNISAINKKFQEELSGLKKLRVNYEQKFIEIKTEQDINKDKFKELQNTNEEQDRRLKILEIQEKVGALIINRNFQRAMEYIAVGLEINPKDLIILKQKRRCLTGMLDYSGAIQCSKVLLEIDPDDLSTILDLAELYLITSDMYEYEKLREKHKIAIIEKRSIFFIWYFDLIKLYVKKDLAAIIQHIEDEIIQKSEGTVKRLENWNFIDMKKAFEKNEETPLKFLVFKSIDFLDGKADVIALNKIKSEAKA